MDDLDLAYREYLAACARVAAAQKKIKHLEAKIQALERQNVWLLQRPRQQEASQPLPFASRTLH